MAYLEYQPPSEAKLCENHEEGTKYYHQDHIEQTSNTCICPNLHLKKEEKKIKPLYLSKKILLYKLSYTYLT